MDPNIDIIKGLAQNLLYLSSKFNKDLDRSVLFYNFLINWYYDSIIIIIFITLE